MRTQLSLVMGLGLVVVLLSVPANGQFVGGSSGPDIAVDPAATTQQAARTEEVVAILRKIQPPTYETKDALAALVAKGSDYVEAMQAAKAMGEKLVGDDELKKDRYEVPGQGTIVDGSPREERVANMTRIRQGVLNKAIAQLMAGYDPLKKIAEWAAKREGDEEAKKLPREPQHIDNHELSLLFGGKLWYEMVIPVGPVMRVRVDGKEPWPMHNLFVLDAKGNVTHISKVQELKQYFIEHVAPLPKVKPEVQAKQVLTAWLAVGPQLANDGYFQFTVDAKTFKTTAVEGGGLKIVGQADVASENAAKGGNQGFVQATLTFDKDGKLTDAEQTAKLREGIRPKCQSTKLLDKDPLVRYMAWQELRVMGRLAKEYLDFQRTQASPELQKEIDRLWQQILEDERMLQNSRP